MIAFLRGVLAEKTPQHAVIDVQGVGYRVFITLGCYESLPRTGDEVRLETTAIVREDAFHLYGFLDREEKEMFLKLNSVTRVGPKLACGVLSGINAESFRNAVLSGDRTALSKIPGVGGKTAERIIMELKDKLGPSFSGKPQTGDLGDAIAALVNLGYKRAEAEKAVAEASAGVEAGDVAAVIRSALKRISG